MDYSISSSLWELPISTQEQPSWSFELDVSSIETKISDRQDNIIKLNEVIKAQKTGQEARREKVDVLLVNLFKAYNACKDKEIHHVGADQIATKEMTSHLNSS